MFRSFLAVMLGFMSILVVRVLANLVAVRVFGSNPALAGRVFVFNIVAIMLAAFLGGLFTGYLAGERRIRHGYVLAIVLLILSALAAVRSPVLGAPIQQILLLVGSPALAVVGAYVSQRLAQRRLG